MSDVGRTAATPSAVVPGDGAASPPGGSPPVDGTPSPGPSGTAPDTRGAELAELRRLLFGAERARLDALDERIVQAPTPDTIAARLPEAITLRGRQDRALARALAPSIESAIGESVRRRPRDFADAIFPVLGPAIRKAIAETMSELVGSINQALQHSFSLRGLSWRFESWRTGVPYAQVLIRHALLYRVEQVFLIHRETGLLLEQAHLPDLALPDADLVSGMLTAIRDFVADSFQQERESGGLRAFSVGELSVIVEPGPNALVAAVVRGQAPEGYARRLRETIESVHAQFGSALADFDGDTAPFGTARPLLDDCLLSVLATDRKADARVAWKPWALAIALIVIALLAWRIWTRLQWRRAVSALVASPGLVVIDEGTGWRSARVRGLRDADAPDPSTVLARAGIDTLRVSQAWEPYLSMRPSLVVRRVERGFGAGAPADSQLALRRDTLVVRGAVQAAWLARVMRDAGGRVPGVATVKRQDVTLVLPAALDAALDTIAQERVFFVPGASRLNARETETVRRIARLLDRLDSGLARVAARAVVTIVGRADDVGNDSLNTALSRKRAEAVMRSLQMAFAAARDADGAPRSPAAVALAATGMGTSDPISTTDSTARARINRSVSFGVRVSIDSTAGASPP